MELKFGIIPTVVTYRFALAACKAGHAWRRCLSLLQEMRSRGIAPDAAAYKLAGTAVAKADRLKELSQLLAVMEREGV
eukprot:14545-Heterococcus_DN1.PRE.1